MHHEIEILYCISGTLHAKLNGIKYLIKADEALIIGSMTDHELVGYNDTRSFCRTFKQIMNMTPLQYRNAPQNI